MTIAHLFNKVYLSFDSLYQPAFDNLLVTQNYYAPSDTFINRHVMMGKYHGKYAVAKDVPWDTFFAECRDTRTIVYASPENFVTIYFSLLRTINPYISKENAFKIFNVVLKRTEFYFLEFDVFTGGLADPTKEALKKDVEAARTCFEMAWNASQPMNIGGDFILNNMGLEFLVARYWVYGRGGEQLKR